MDGTESVGHVDLGHGSQLLCEGGIVLGLALFKAGVFQQQDLTGLQGRGLSLSILTHNVAGEDNFLSQQLCQTGGYGSQGQLLLLLAPGSLGEFCGILTLFCLLFDPFVKIRLGLSQVRAGNHRRALIQQIPNGGQSGHDALVTGDGTGLFVLRDIEIAAEKDLLALHVDVADGLFLVIHKQTPKHIVDLQCF